MAPRFRRVDRDQRFLLPPDVREWLPAGHPALFVLSLVEQLDLSEFERRYRSSQDRGRPAFHPQVMVGVALYASMTAVMSSRRIERLLVTDVAFRVVAANERPDHSTICRFLTRHRESLATLFAKVVGLAAEAGLVDPTLVAVDGTKLPGDASTSRNQKLGDLRERFRRWAETVEDNDASEDAAASDTPEPAEEMFDRESMRDWIRRRLDERVDDDADRQMNVTDPDSGLLPRSGGGWVQGYNATAAAVEGGIVVAADVTANSNDTTMLEPMVRQIEDAVETATGQRAGVVVADAGYWDTDTIDRIEADPELPDLLVATGRWLPDTVPEPLAEPDPAGYERAVAVHDAALEQEHQRRVAVMVRVINGELLLREAGELLGISDKRVWGLKQQWVEAGGPHGIEPQRIKSRQRPPRIPRSTRARHAMTTRLAKPAGRSLYRQRQTIIEPVFGDIKTNRRITRFLRRGHDAVRAEWQWILTGHNLTILHRRQVTAS
jgi:transposase